MERRLKAADSGEVWVGQVRVFGHRKKDRH